jgi:hypothetical protein
MRRLAQSTAHVVMLKAFLDTDHLTAATGKTIAITISKAGGAFANPNAGATNATEVSSGWYKVTLDTTDTNTIGDLVVRGTNADIDDTEQVCQVVSATTGGATNLDAAVSTLATQVSVDALPTAIENADALLNRDMATGTDSGSSSVRTVRQALRFIRNKWSISGTTLTVCKEDDSTASWTSEVTGTAAADPITASDPAGP